MKFPWMVPTALVCALVVTGCDSGEDEDDAVIEREARVDTPNGTLEIHVGTTTDVEECLIFDIGDGGISARAIDASGDPTDDFFLLLQEGDDGGLFSPIVENPDGGTVGGVEVCAAGQSADGNAQLTDTASGEVLYTLAGNFVLRGDVHLSHRRFIRFLQIAKNIAFEIRGDQVFDRFAPRFRHPDPDEILVTATAEIEDANDARKLNIAALVDGACGSPGYDAYPEPDAAAGGDAGGSDDDDDSDSDD